MEYKIHFIGNLTAQQRPLGLARRINGKTIVKQIDRPESRNFKAVVSLLAQEELIRQKGLPIENACAVAITAVKKIPDSWSNKKRTEALAGLIVPTSKPDVDNLAKGIMDAFSGVLYRDDRLVTSLSISKKYGEVEGFYATVTDEAEF